IMEEIKAIRQDIRELKSFQDKITVSTEEEATGVTSYYLRKNYGIDVTLETVYVDTDVEVDIYGVKGDICVFGEAAVRLGTSKIRDLLNKFDYVRRKFPSWLREKTILVLYGMRILPNVVEEAKKHGIWVVTASKELTKLKIQKTNEIK
ncbi:MAG: hypothetical protein ACP6IP_07825, partial [Candidatus Njordarchaeia archaeon]